MRELRKITVQVPERDLEMAQELTGQGVAETVRAALRKLAQTQEQLRALRGTFQFTIDLDELREDRNWCR